MLTQTQVSEQRHSSASFQVSDHYPPGLCVQTHCGHRMRPLGLSVSAVCSSSRSEFPRSQEVGKKKESSMLDDSVGWSRGPRAPGRDKAVHGPRPGQPGSAQILGLSVRPRGPGRRLGMILLCISMHYSALFPDASVSTCITAHTCTHTHTRGMHTGTCTHTL